LSTNFRLIAVAVGQTKKCVKRLCWHLAEKNDSRKPLVFDAVYLVIKIKSGRVDITHALLDCYDEI
jgi:dipeptide/tripeptide permease